MDAPAAESAAQHEAQQVDQDSVEVPAEDAASRSSSLGKAGQSHVDAPARGSFSHGSQEAPPTPTCGLAGMPTSPGHEGWLTEPPSIEEPLLLLDESGALSPEDEATHAAQLQELGAQLAEARASCKADKAALEALQSRSEQQNEEWAREVAAQRSQQVRLEQENTVLREQLQDHHGIMAADWAQTIAVQEKLRQEEAGRERLQSEVEELRAALVESREDVAALRQDAGRWRIICTLDSLNTVSSDELNTVLKVLLPALGPLHKETIARSVSAEQQLHSELENQLCVVCRDAKKAVLFQPCLHVCVCEGCRDRLQEPNGRLYRCPMCQVPVSNSIGRVHF
eukprot:TRINITY_DN111982_c0_g1_i1.p1 TRINITY_DN111982_c0_g1~~TRINITY_DN111982_c0_g1_i1.p1  ORF type:complete len:340 (+),score=87.85 TRINITY_DN111982_c0_g1_i1:95-1114(+)